MTSTSSRKIEGWRAREQREHEELLQAVLKRDGAFALLDEGKAIDQVHGDQVKTVSRKGRKHQYLRNETGVRELKEASAQRIRAYKAEWIRRKRAENPEAAKQVKRIYKAKRTPEQVAYDNFVMSMYNQLVRLAGLASRSPKSKAPDLCSVWANVPAANNSDSQEVA